MHTRRSVNHEELRDAIIEATVQTRIAAIALQQFAQALIESDPRRMEHIRRRAAKVICRILLRSRSRLG